MLIRTVSKLSKTVKIKGRLFFYGCAVLTERTIPPEPQDIRAFAWIKHRI
jgi:hypothetical protein